MTNTMQSAWLNWSATAKSALQNYLMKRSSAVSASTRSARQQLDSARPTGRFAGIPFLMKDLGQAVAGVPLNNGSRFFNGYVPDYDAEMVGRLHAVGLTTFAKTSAPELGLLDATEPALFGPTRNPWALDRTAGGSSGGSAAAIAAGIVPMASGGDGGGSLRIPASCCGLVGLKPSRGRNPSGPELGEGWYGQVQYGVISRSVRDTAAALDATAGGDAGMPYAAPQPPLKFEDEVGREPGQLRIAVVRDAMELSMKVLHCWKILAIVSNRCNRISTEWPWALRFLCACWCAPGQRLLMPSV